MSTHDASIKLSIANANALVKSLKALNKAIKAEEVDKLEGLVKTVKKDRWNVNGALGVLEYDAVELIPSLKIAALMGQSIMNVTAHSEELREANGWDDDIDGGVTIHLSNGVSIHGSGDPEGNRPGSMFYVDTNGDGFHLFPSKLEEAA